MTTIPDRPAYAGEGTAREPLPNQANIINSYKEKGQADVQNGRVDEFQLEVPGLDTTVTESACAEFAAAKGRLENQNAASKSDSFREVNMAENERENAQNAFDTAEHNLKRADTEERQDTANILGREQMSTIPGSSQTFTPDPDQTHYEAPNRYGENHTLWKALSMVIVSGLGAFDVHVTADALRLVQMADTVRWVVAGGFAFVVLFLAHKAGIAIKANSPKSREYSAWSRWHLAGMVVFFTAIVSGVLGFIRAKMVLGQPGSNVSQVLGDSGSVIIIVLFMAIQLGIVLAALVISMFVHNVCLGQHQKSRAVLKEATEKYQAAQKRLNLAEANVKDKQRVLDTCDEVAAATVEEYRRTYQRAVATYYRGVVEASSSPQITALASEKIRVAEKFDPATGNWS